MESACKETAGKAGGEIKPTTANRYVSDKISCGGVVDRS